MNGQPTDKWAAATRPSPVKTPSIAPPAHYFRLWWVFRERKHRDNL